MYQPLYESPFKTAAAWEYFGREKTSSPWLSVPLQPFSYPDHHASHSSCSLLRELLPVALTHSREAFGEWPNLIYTSRKSLLRQVWAGNADSATNLED